MSTSLLSYSGIITKAKALEGNLLSDSDYEKISTLTSTAEFVNFLKQNKSYTVVFHDYDENTLHRAKIEQLLSNALLLDFSRLYKFATGEQRTVLSFHFFRFEVNILKSLLEMVYNKGTEYDLLYFNDFFRAHSDLKVKELAASNTMDEFISNLQGTKYFDLFKRLQATGHSTLKDYTVQLDIYQFTQVWKTKERLLTGTNLKLITQLYGVHSDLLNLLWIYRSKKFFDINPTSILASSIPINYKLKQEEVKKLVEAVSVEEFMKILQTTYYSKLISNSAEQDIEKCYSKYYQNLYKKLSSKYSTSMAPISQFLYKKELELDLLTTALECIRYRLDPSMTLEYLKH